MTGATTAAMLAWSLSACGGGMLVFTIASAVSRRCNGEARHAVAAAAVGSIAQAIVTVGGALTALYGSHYALDRYAPTLHVELFIAMSLGRVDEFDQA